MPLIETRGAGSAQGFGEFAQSAAPVYIEDVFSTYLYTGNGAARSITNGIDLSGKGGLVWTKSRSNTADHSLTDTATGANKQLITNSTLAQQSYANELTAFNSNGYNLGNNSSYGATNVNNWTYASWTFRKQAKFFDVVTYTGNGTAGRTVAHNLGSVPGCIIVRRLNTAQNWAVYHRSISATSLLILNETGASTSNIAYWNNTEPTDSVFTVGVSGLTNGSGDSYVAYLFAHDAGGFGLSGSDNVISCGSFTTDGSGNATVSLGYEPQYLLWKRTDSTSNWLVLDNMRGWANGSTDSLLRPNVSDVESTGADYGFPTATGFYMTNMVASATYIYIAIRRGPMKVPTSGTSVYEGTAYTGNAASNRQIGSSVLTDLLLLDSRDATAFSWSSYGQIFFDRLRGQDFSLGTATTSAETNGWSTYFNLDMNAGWDTGTTASQDYLNKSGSTYVSHAFRRAPGFFDVVCYTGTGSSQNITHNLGVAPELIICKARTDPGGLTPQWTVGFSFNSTNFSYAYLNLTAAATTPGSYTGQSTFSAQPTSTQFTVNTYAGVNQNGAAMIAYLFATVAGVSKVGSYTGSGTTKQIDCGFTGGARFVLIKRTDNVGDWYVWDTARGIVSGNDPYLLLNSTAAEVTNTDYVDTYSAGFELSSTAPAALNANGGSFIFFAVA